MYTQKKPIENTHIVRERDRQRNRELLAVLSLGIPIGLFLLLFTWQNLEVIRLGREATRLQQNLKDLEATQKSLEAELDRRTSFDTVATQARDLGFEPSAPKTIVMVTRQLAERQLAVGGWQLAGAKPEKQLAGNQLAVGGWRLAGAKPERQLAVGSWQLAGAKPVAQGVVSSTANRQPPTANSATPGGR